MGAVLRGADAKRLRPIFADATVRRPFRALGLALPSLLADPFAHTLVMLDQFAPFPTELGGEDFTATARAPPVLPERAG